MSAKWRALQHRHRYTYSAVVFPPYFVQALNATPYSSPFLDELKHLVLLNSTYAQLEHIKKVAAALSNLISDANSGDNVVSCSVKLCLEILFLENSSPLHRTLVSVLAKCKKFQSLIERCFRQLCEDYGCGRNTARNGKRFCVSRAALSMMSTPKLGYLVEVIEQCAVLVGLDVVSGLHSVVNETNELAARPSPIIMEQCQDALSCLYYLLQRFPDKFCQEGLTLSDESVLAMAFRYIVIILKSQAFSRDCLVAAGVSFCAALHVCLSLDELGLLLMEGILYQTGIQDSKVCLNDAVGKIPYKGDLLGEISNFSALSRLCLIRGILTAVPRTVLDTQYVYPLSDDCEGLENGGHAVKTILYDAILPELCSYAENPTDSHFNFHALTVMQICMQQIKTLLQGDTSGIADNYIRIPEEMGVRILRIVWNNMEDPLSQTVKQVNLIFDLYLDIQSSLNVEGSENTKLFLIKIASDLLCLGPRCKGRYIPLASLTRRLGAKSILDLNPDLINETTKAYMDDDVCCAATTFLKCFLECLRDGYWSSDGVDGGYAKYRDHCLPSFLHGLASGMPKLRSNLNTYALPVLLDLDADCIFSMLSLIGVGRDEDPLSTYTESCTNMDLGLEQQIAVLVSLLKVSRVLALMEGDIDWDGILTVSSERAVFDVANSNVSCIVCIKGVEVKIPVKWLLLALTHIDEPLRMDAAEALFLNPKTASLPSSLELSLMRRAIPLNMRCSSTAFQMKWNSLFRKFFSRVRTALERQLKQGTWKPLSSQDSNGACSYTGSEKAIKQRAESLFDFTKWLSCFLFFSCYPSAPYERKIMAMDLMLIMFNVWPVVPTLPESHSVHSETNLYPYSKSFILPDSTLLLVGSIVDSWDRLRESSFRILLNFPTPLPGFCSPEMVQKAIIWAKKLICSPRVRETDAGALTLRLLFRKYVLELSWTVKPSSNFVAFSSDCGLSKSNGIQQNYSSSYSVVSYVASLIDWLLSAVEDAENNLSEACKNSFVHGILLALRYTFEELDWNSNVFMHNFTEMKHSLERLLELVMRITSLALCVVSADAWYLPDDMEEMVDEEFLLEPDEIDSSGQKLQMKSESSEAVDDAGPSAQIVMVGCWLAMKEVSLLLGTVIRKVPLPTVDDKESTTNSIDESTVVSNAMLDLKQLETIGNHFLEVLLKMKHNGAIDKTRAGFTALCNRLLCSNDPRLCKLTESWMEHLMERTVAKGQTVDDLLRRSAGIPAAFIAFFLSEPEGAPKRLLPRALRWLMDVVKKSLIDQPKNKSSNGDMCRQFLSEPSQLTTCTVPLDTFGNTELSKFRDEGVVPTVHTFNVLRAAFNDTNLATDTSGFSAEAMIMAIRSFSSPYWEVRNSACQAYTALVRRMIGFLNVQKRESARRALTGLEFFHRYPTLHSFLLDELKVATEFLFSGSSEQLESNLKNAVHPSLCPMLILLSRLKPSPISSEAGDPLDPLLFMQYIRRCSVQSNLRIRVLASKALTGLVANEKLQDVVLNIASELPYENIHARAPDSFCHSDSCSTDAASCSFNSIHGILLQLNALVDANCWNLTDSSKKDKLLCELVQILATRSWMGRPQCCGCPIVNASFLKVLDNMLCTAKICTGSRSAGAIWNLLWELSSECLDLEPVAAQSYFDPTIQELRKQAASSYFNCVYQSSKLVEDDFLKRRHTTSPATCPSRVVGDKVAFNGFQERLIRCMSNASYEVRIATLKWLFLFLQSYTAPTDYYRDQLNSEALRSCLINVNLQDTVLSLMISEKHHKCMRYFIKILYVWNSLEFQDNRETSVGPGYVCSMDRASIFQLWNKLVSLFKITRHAKTRQTLICCLGICMKRIANLYLSSVSSIEKIKAVEPIQEDLNKMFSDFYDALSHFVDLIEHHSEASVPVNMRKAAAESLVASGLLSNVAVLGPLVSSHRISEMNKQEEEAIRLYARKVLNLWFTCIKLLEDEDLGIRKSLAMDVQNCFLSRRIPGKNAYAAASSCQVERVFELCFEHLSNVLGHWLDYLDYLFSWVLNAANNANHFPGGDLVRRVFDKEIDNHHEEKVLICQICCSQLEDIEILKPKASESWIHSEARNVLYKWRTRFFEQLIAFSRKYMGERETSDWIGGIGNHKDAFLPVYGNLLAFYASSNCILKHEPENSGNLLSEVRALGDAINPFLGNPLICNLYLIIVKSHERFSGEMGDDLRRKLGGSNSSWVEFTPYFLLLR